ncbi:uncharacterized protein LOC62_05G007112 [Vanrija pseudolonga]|uniref:Uncharacterized protein n=1 Tax=Vanrija pseudolonga TaxID=143232 RepID=A0AAF1BNV5_9TREE|nr:hypothetical protein LOC62_05G007112 [Vanrija pseudolonga]
MSSDTAEEYRLPPDLIETAFDAVVIHDLGELKTAARQFPECIGDAHAGVFYLFVGDTLVGVCDEGYGAEMIAKLGPLDAPEACTIATEDYVAAHKFKPRSTSSSSQNASDVAETTPGYKLLTMAAALRRTCEGCALNH